MHLRRSLALGSGALLLTASLSACGFDLATDRVNNIANGATDRDTSLDVLNTVIVSAEDGSGVLVGALVNNDIEAAATLEGLQPIETAGESGQASAFPDFAPVEVAPNGLVTLGTDGEPITVEGDFGPGDVVSVGAQISGGQVVELDIPVVEACGDYAGIIEGTDDVECEISEPVGEH